MRCFGHINRTKEALITTIYKGRMNESKVKTESCGWIDFQKKRDDKFNKQKSMFKSVQRSLANIRKYGKVE